jgi:pimeloyl-ACP methyl ester carboxylesterase
MRRAVPPPRETFDLVMGDGAIVRVRRHGRAEGTRLYVSHGNGFAVDGYYPFWGPLAERFDVIVFDARSHGQSLRAASGRDGHTYAQMTLDLAVVMREVTARLGPRPSVGVFHSMSARAAMKHAIELGFPWEALILFDSPNAPPPGHAVTRRWTCSSGAWPTGRSRVLTRSPIRASWPGNTRTPARTDRGWRERTT